MPKPKINLNPPLPDEGPRENVANAASILWSIEEAPHLFEKDDVRSMIKAAALRLETALKQLEPFRWTGSGFVGR